MLKKIQRAMKRISTTKEEYVLWRENDRIRELQPTRLRAKIVIAAMGQDGLSTRGKVKPKRFFPPFCRVLAQCGVGSVYVNNIVEMERELRSSDAMPTILIDLVNEDHDDLDAYEIPGGLGTKPGAVFNSRRVAKIIGDKKAANLFLSDNDILMPCLANPESKMILSNARIGSQEQVFVYGDAKEIDSDRYNTEFVDTKICYGSDYYYTTVRLMCIGSRLLSVYVRARDVKENNPSVHNSNTPRDCALLNFLYGRLIESRLGEYLLLAEKMGSALGPGFYAHDVLVDNDSSELYVCETGFKFFDGTYWDRMGDVIEGSKFQAGFVDQETYAGYAASVFVTYCAEMGFL